MSRTKDGKERKTSKHETEIRIYISFNELWLMALSCNCIIIIIIILCKTQINSHNSTCDIYSCRQGKRNKKTLLILKRRVKITKFTNVRIQK